MRLGREGRGKNARWTDVDLHRSVRSLLKVNEELGLEDARDERVALLLRVGEVERHPIVPKVRESDGADGNERNLALAGGLRLTVDGLRDEDVDGLVGLSGMGVSGERDRMKRERTNENEETGTRLGGATKLRDEKF